MGFRAYLIPQVCVQRQLYAEVHTFLSEVAQQHDNPGQLISIRGITVCQADIQV